MPFGQNSRFEFRISKLRRRRLGRRLKPWSESIDHSRTCREDLDNERSRGSEKRRITHNSVFAAHRLKKCRMTNREIDIRHFLFGGRRSVVSQTTASPARTYLLV